MPLFREGKEMRGDESEREKKEQQRLSTYRQQRGVPDRRRFCSS